MLRHSCAVCPYHLGERKADITIADFWGVGEVVPEMDGNAGTSMVICHTEKGKALLNEASVNLNMRQVKLSGDFISRKNPNLLRPSRIYKDRETFEKEYAEKGFRHVARKWGDMGWRYKAWQLKVLIRRLTGRR
jgi:coenzyme F420-reducing hydrogenase beta subunit